MTGKSFYNRSNVKNTYLRYFDLYQRHSFTASMWTRSLIEIEISQVSISHIGSVIDTLFPIYILRYWWICIKLRAYVTAQDWISGTWYAPNVLSPSSPMGTPSIMSSPSSPSILASLLVSNSISMSWFWISSVGLYWLMAPISPALHLGTTMVWASSASSSLPVACFSCRAKERRDYEKFRKINPSRKIDIAKFLGWTKFFNSQN